MPRFLLILVAFVVVLYAFIDVVQTPSTQTRSVPKPVWLLVVALVPVLGAVAWFFLGRPSGEAVLGGPRRSVPRAPDDDPAFLRSIDDTTWSQRMRQRRERRADGPSADDNGPAPLA